MTGYDGRRGWLYAAAVLNSRQGRGIGKALIREAEDRLIALGCRKINLQIRSTNTSVVSFYRKLGYDVGDRVSMGRRFSNEATAKIELGY
jgi:ribosomal protein S18 acetylase RimI-like enzyme